MAKWTRVHLVKTHKMAKWTPVHLAKAHKMAKWTRFRSLTMTSLREKKRDGDCSIDNNHRIHNDPLFKTSVDNKAEKKENASNVVRVSHGINKAKLSERIKLNLAQITEPKLSCFGDGVLEFEIEAPEKNSGQKSCSFNVIKNKSTNMKSILKLSSLQNWKAVTEQKMKEKRTKEMAERQKLYNMEQLQFSSVAKNLQDDAELEEEEDFSDENVSNGSNSSDDEHLYENELEENNPAIEETWSDIVIF
uniref:Uncharacterized protein n=1 Tax=Romanomermis culicivorax TaxID=13658 RepID=A0A915LAV0_ROMCU